MKVLIITPHDLQEQNGTSNYGYKLVQLCLKLGLTVDYFHYFNLEFENKDWKVEHEEFNRINLDIPKKIYRFYEQDYCSSNEKFVLGIRKKLEDFIQKQNYSLILDMSTFASASLMQQNNYFYIQQMQVCWYDQNCNNQTIFNPLIYAKNLVLFDRYQLKKYEKNKNYFFIPLASFSEEFILEQKKKVLANLKNKFKGNIVYIGRINDAQKNVSLLSELNSQYYQNIDIYGPNNDNLQLCNYHRALERREIVPVLEASKFFILVSKTEGFSYSVVEAISTGTPPIILNTYESAQFLTSNRNGFLIDENSFVNEISSILSNIKNISLDQYKKVVMNNLEFALNNLTIEQFERKWRKIINHFI